MKFQLNDPVPSWLLEGDISIQYQTYRDLLEKEKPALRNKISTEGWGLKLLSCRNPTGHWGSGFYNPKWTSSHYTLLDLRYLNILPGIKTIAENLDLIFNVEKGPDGGIGPFGKGQKCDVCVNGMVLNYASYFGVDENRLKSIVDFLISKKMVDGGFNCRVQTSGATHSSLHTTLSVLEGIEEYKRNNYHYRLPELKQIERGAQEFILMHHLYKSDKTGNIIKQDFMKLYYPGRWYYDILKSMDYFQSARVPYDQRMDDALELLQSKKTKEGYWLLEATHPGKSYFEMEKKGKPSRWNTLRALRVLKYYS